MPHHPLRTLAALALAFAWGVRAHDNGMDMSMDGGMSMSMGNMVMYLHFTPGDNLWFLGWAPFKAGAMGGVCVGLFLLALFERWLAAIRGVMEVHWYKAAQMALADRLNRAGEPGHPATTLRSALNPRRAPPFIPAHDISRGILFIGQAALSYAFMLAVMTFQVGFILSIVIGLGVGEALFGRYAAHGAHLH